MKTKLIYTSILFSFTLYNCTPSNTKKTVEKVEKSEPTEELSPLELGQSFAMKTKATLGKNLMAAISSKGPEYAVTFCSTKAIPLTDSVALSLNVKINRVSDQNRNPQNKANASELTYIQNTKLVIAEGKSPKPQLIETDNKQIAYYPIITDNMCMLCHGKVDTDIASGTLAKIKELYPKDLATGYKINELRGIWVVEMDKK